VSSKKSTLSTVSQEKSPLPKAEFIQGEIDYPEMINKDFRKAVTIVLLTILSTLIFVGGVFAIAFFV
jgi:hypothetical protein